MASYPRLSIGTVEDSHNVTDAIGVYIERNPGIQSQRFFSSPT